MKKKYRINFLESLSPITEPVTKFGGQPVWIEKPEWAVSRSTGKPMMFIGQIRLEEEIFGQTESKMAYLFMTEEEDFVDGTWNPNSGENAVIIQPGGNNPPSAPIEIGQTINVFKEIPGESWLKPFPCEFAVEKAEIVADIEKLFHDELDDEDADFEDESAEEPDFSTDDSDEEEPGFENKLGGYPNFLQAEEYPDENNENWNLLLQLDSGSTPFDINFGDLGIGYAFISKDGKTGKFLWQCS